ncbi:hypothetical protein LSAT2_021547 [Lamellibrachia satsuma]|nr:hypothetical protein LSAT2_021547 [Lamellibrachia satsuma]
MVAIATIMILILHPNLPLLAADALHSTHHATYTNASSMISMLLPGPALTRSTSRLLMDVCNRKVRKTMNPISNLSQCCHHGQCQKLVMDRCST